MTRSQADWHTQELRAIEIIERVTDAVEKWARTEIKIGKKPLSIAKKERALSVAAAVLGLHKISVHDVFIDIVIESTCLYHDTLLNQEDISKVDPTADEDPD